MIKIEKLLRGLVNKYTELQIASVRAKSGSKKVTVLHDHVLQ